MVQPTTTSLNDEIAKSLVPLSSEDLFRIVAVIIRLLSTNASETVVNDTFPSVLSLAVDSKVNDMSDRQRATGGKAKKKKETKTKIGSRSPKAVCPSCGKKVTARFLREHMNTHLMYASRPYRCAICHRCYAYKSDLSHHMRYKHHY
jgi:hypothetical protein